MRTVRKYRLSAAAAVATLSMMLMAIALPSAASTTGSGAGTRVAGAIGVGTADAATTSNTTASCPWLNQRLPVSTRVSMLLPKMTLAQKISMVTGQPGTSPAGAIGATPAIASLCIPAMSGEDGPLGVGDGLTGVTQLPATVALASSWSPMLAREYGTVLGAEQHGKGMNIDLGPTINIQRDPRWGRNFEAISEDPYLDGQIAMAEIRGIQSQDVIAEVKHFAVYNQETNRNSTADDAVVSDRAINEIYLPAFYDSVMKAGAGAVMCGYSVVNGQFDCENQYLLGILDKQWGYPGFVGSDWGATHSTIASAEAGLDLEMPSAVFYGSVLQGAVESGQLPESTVNQMVSRILTEMFRFNFFNSPPTGNSNTVVSTAAHVAFSLKAAEQGTVLLQNTDRILPLTASDSSIAVIGADGSTSPESDGGGSAGVNPSAPVVSPLQAIEAQAPSGVTVTSYAGTDTAAAAAAAASAKVAIVFANNYESEGSDLTTLNLQNNQDAYIEAVAAANPHTIVVLNAGGPVLMPWLSQVKGVIEAWYPGQEDGDAIAPILFGTVDPSGHLAETFPASMSQMPTSAAADFPGVNGTADYSEGIDVGYRWYDANNVAPLFPFGYGLSYTTFTFSDLSISPKQLSNTTSGPGASSCGCNGQGTRMVTVSAKVTNTGTVAGADVAQLYVGDPAVAGEPPRQLEGFSRVELQPGQSRIVHFTLDGHELSYWDAAANGWVLPDGTFSVSVGDSSALANLPLKGSFAVSKSLGARYATVTSAPTTVAPDSTFTVRTQFVNDGDFAMSGVRFSLKAPRGWTATAINAPRSVAAGQSATVDFRVHAPEGAQGQTVTLTAAAASSVPSSGGLAGGRPAGRPALRPANENLVEAATSVAVESLGTGSISPSTVIVQPGSSTTVTLAVANNLGRPFTLDYDATAPSGVTVTPAKGSVTVPATGAKVALKLAVAAGTGGGSNAVSLALTGVDGQQRYTLPTAKLTVSVPYASFSDAFDNVGITDNSDSTPGNYDGVGSSFSEQNLTASGLAPGATVYQDGARLTWPNVAAGQPDNVVALGQTIDLSGQGSTLVLLGSSDDGDATGNVTVNYTDGTSQTAPITMTDWYDNAPATGDGIVAETLSWNRQPGDTTGAHQTSIYSAQVALDPAKTVESVTLPNVTTITDGSTPIHIFAMGVGNGSASVPFASLQDAFNGVGISAAGDPSAANYDGNSDSFVADSLASGTPQALTPGGTVVQDGVTLTWPNVAAGSLDNVIAEGQTIKLAGTGSNLVFLGSANNGTATGSGVITYSDGSTQSYSLSFADWWANSAVSGSAIVSTTNWAYALSTESAHAVSIYSAAIPLQAGKTVVSVTLPSISNGIGGGLTDMHIFAMGIG